MLARHGERLSGIVRVTVGVQHVDPLVVVRIDEGLARVHRARVPIALEGPRLTVVFGAIETGHTLFVRGRGVEPFALLYGGVEDPWIRLEDRDPDATDITGRQAVVEPRIGELGPRRSSVHGLPHRASGATAMKPPRATLPLVGGCVEYAGRVRVHRDVYDASEFVCVEDEFPVFSAIGCFVEAALFIRAPEMSQGCDVDDVGVIRVHDDSADVMAFGEPHVRPRLATVDRLVDAVAPPRALSIGTLARTDPNDVGLLLVDNDVTHGVNRFVLKYRFEPDAVVRRLPHAAGSRRDVEDLGVRVHDRDIDEPPTHGGGSDVSRSETIEIRRGQLTCQGGRGRHPKEGESEQSERVAHRVLHT